MKNLTHLFTRTPIYLLISLGLFIESRIHGFIKCISNERGVEVVKEEPSRMVYLNESCERSFNHVWLEELTKKRGSEAVL